MLLSCAHGDWVARRDQPGSSILGTWQDLRQLMVHELLPNSIGTGGTGLNRADEASAQQTRQAHCAYGLGCRGCPRNECQQGHIVRHCLGLRGSDGVR